MPRAKAKANKDKTDAELANGRGTDYKPMVRYCKYPKCYFSSRNKDSVDYHNNTTKHENCSIDNCDGQFSKGQRACHLARAHGIEPQQIKTRFQCRHADCEWYAKSAKARETHEDKMHVACQYVGCEFRGERRLFLQHERDKHDENDEQWKRNLSWTPAEQAVLDFIWLKHQSFNDLLDVILKLFPHRIATSAAPLSNIASHIRKHISRYENMDMSLRGEGVVRHLQEKALL